MAKTNKELVAHVQRALSERWGYVWGTYGQVLTAGLLESKLKQYTKEIGGHAEFIQSHYLNKTVADCVGLIKSCVWWDYIKDRPTYTAATDINADMMYNRATRKGAIASLPEVPGICVYKRGHIGVYVGDGEVIEANSTLKGVIKTKLTKAINQTGWTHWLECPFIEYEKTRQQYQAIIQDKCKFQTPADVWKYLDQHPSADALYKKWAESY